MSDEFNYRLLKKTDCSEIAEIRLGAKEWGFLPAMGKTFYAELLKATCASKYGFGIICEDKHEKIAGFVCASIDLPRYHFDIILRKGIVLIFIAIISCVKNPKLISGLIQYIRYPQSEPCKNIKAEWLTMVIRKDYRGKGIGREITTNLIEEFKERGVKQFKSTVPANNLISCSLHEKYGFRLVDTFDLHGSCMNMYVYDVL